MGLCYFHSPARRFLNFPPDDSGCEKGGVTSRRMQTAVPRIFMTLYVCKGSDVQLLGRTLFDGRGNLRRDSTV